MADHMNKKLNLLNLLKTNQLRKDGLLTYTIDRFHVKFSDNAINKWLEIIIREGIKTLHTSSHIASIKNQGVTVHLFLNMCPAYDINNIIKIALYKVS